jgi:hypothetical protein
VPWVRGIHLVCETIEIYIQRLASVLCNISNQFSSDPRFPTNQAHFFGLDIKMLSPLQISAIILASSSSLVHSTTPPSYNPFTQSATIPYDTTADPYPFTSDLRTTVQVSSGVAGGLVKTYHPVIDTGSTGFMISAADLPNFGGCDTLPHGWEFLSSSKKLYSGCWVPYDVVFKNAATGLFNIKARLPILAVEQRSVCPDYDEDVDTWSCPAPSGSVENMPTGIRLMGVGFGRQNDGMPQGNPDKNTLLNIQSIAGTTVTGSAAFRVGYIIRDDGITVGLTRSNMAPFATKTVKLSAGSSADYRDWAAVPVCIGVNHVTCVNGDGLIDTGIDQSYMHGPTAWLSVVSRTGFVINNGETVQWKFGTATEGYVVSEDFTVGDAPGIASGVVPREVSLYLHPSSDGVTPRVNTGRHILRRWDLAFDADFGSLSFAAA